VDLRRLAVPRRAVSLPWEPTYGGRFVIPVGRQHQPEFFEALVPMRERLACISRTHFELTWEPSGGGSPMLRKLSGNSLVLDNRAISPEEIVPVWDGVCLSFSGIGDNDPNFLLLRVVLRLHDDDSMADASNLAALSLAQGQQGVSEVSVPGPFGATQKRQAGSEVAVLECVHAEGTKLSRLAPEMRTILLPQEETLELGRQQQLGFFDELLKAAPQWLTYISRTHCRVTVFRAGMQPMQPGAGFVLQVENLSANVVLICGRQLAKGQSDAIAEGGTLAFVAKLRDSHEETQFLRFELRRIRSRSALTYDGGSAVH